jgi:hypothetical protein
MPSQLTRSEAILAMFEIKETFKDITDEDWDIVRSIIWAGLTDAFVSTWCKAKLYALPDTGEFWKERLTPKQS